MAGALSSQGMQIVSADTDILADGLLMLRYVASDSVSPETPTPERLAEVCKGLVDSVDSEVPPKFRTVWGQQQLEHSRKLSPLPNDVRIDNTLSDEFTIIEVFSFDRTGLLYSLARKLHDMRLVIGHAKIGTYLDQVVDVFYVTERDGSKPKSMDRIDQIRDELMQVIAPAPLGR